MDGQTATFPCDQLSHIQSEGLLEIFSSIYPNHSVWRKLGLPTEELEKEHTDALHIEKKLLTKCGLLLISTDELP